MRKITASLLMVFMFSINGMSWGNAGKSTSASKPKFAMHDWIALEGYKLAKDDADLKWVTNNLDMYLYGTEAPDFGVLKSVINQLHPGTGYKDSVKCHCILFNKNEDVVNDRMEVRVKEEFDKAKAALANHDPKLAAFYAGAMAHYMGDLSQFMHLMGKGSRWGSEDQKIHHAYEVVADNKIDSDERTSLAFEGFVKKHSVSGSKPETIALNVAKFVEEGEVDGLTPGAMYKEWNKLRAQKKGSNPAKWSEDFRNQTGHNINQSINGVSKLLRLLSE